MPKQARVVRSFPVPIGGFGDAGHDADWVLFTLSDAADFLCRSNHRSNSITRSHKRIMQDSADDPAPSEAEREGLHHILPR